MGTLDVHEQNADDTCGDPVALAQWATLVPSGGNGTAGNGCLFFVESAEDCLGEPLDAGEVVCLPCVDECPEISGSVALGGRRSSQDFFLCTNVVLSATAGAMCTSACDGQEVFAFVEVPD